MSVREFLLQARSYRRFDEGRAIDPAFVEGCVDALRFVPSGANSQPLRYALSTSREVNARLFPHLRWAAKIRGWNGPAEGERPAAYVVIGGDARWPACHMIDAGIAAQSLLLLLAEAGLCGCMLGSIDAEGIRKVVGFEDGVSVLLVVAIGYPGETVVIDEMEADGDTAYYRDADGVHHVPKRPLSEVLVKRFVD